MSSRFLRLFGLVCHSADWPSQRFRCCRRRRRRRSAPPLPPSDERETHTNSLTELLMSGLDSFEQVGGKKERANGWITGSSLASTDPALIPFESWRKKSVRFGENDSKLALLLYCTTFSTYLVLLLELIPITRTRGTVDRDQPWDGICVNQSGEFLSDLNIGSRVLPALLMRLSFTPSLLPAI